MLQYKISLIKKFIALFCLIALFASCKRNDEIVIKGKISDSSFPKVYLLEMNLGDVKVLDSLSLGGNGSFKFKIKATEPGFYYLKFSYKKFVSLLAKPGERIKVQVDGSNFSSHYTIEGSVGSEQVKMLNDKLVSTKLAIDSLRALYKEKEKTPGFDTISRNLDEKYKAVIKDQRYFSIKFIIEHLNSLASILALYQELDEGEYVLNQNRDVQYVKLVSDTLRKYYPKSKFVVSLWNERERLLSKMSLMRVQSMGLKAKTEAYPEIKLPSVKGDSIKLTSVKAKYMLVNFWSMRNKESVYAFGNIVKIYNDYHKMGFEIYNIALDEDLETWRHFIKSNNIPGIQVIDQQGGNSYYARLYNVTNLPASYLIDKNNNIVAKDIYGSDLVNKLEELTR
jgi:hypothetical protein